MAGGAGPGGLPGVSEEEVDPAALGRGVPRGPGGASTRVLPEPAEAGPLGWEGYFDSATQVDVAGRGDFRVYQAGASGPVLLLLHGGGYSGMTWALVARRLAGDFRVVAPDLRGHGLSRTSDDADLSAGTLAGDAGAVWQAIFGAEAPPTVVVGHSMGGAVAVRLCASPPPGLRVCLAGIVVLDVVEGTALASLAHMRGVLAKRPAGFPSVEAAVAWALRTGATRNVEAARVSIPSQVRPPEAPGGLWRWVAKLAESERFWDGWYRGLSELFLALPAPKLLLLAGTDRLDKPLTIGQMQGKFQMTVLPAGHAIHEDEPERVASALAGFVRRFRIGQALPPALAKMRE